MIAFEKRVAEEGKPPTDHFTGRPARLRPAHRAVPVTAEMVWWLRLDEELVGALDQNGCFPDPVAVNDLLPRYGIVDEESQRTARQVLRYLGIGRAENMMEDAEEETDPSNAPKDQDADDEEDE